MKYLMVNVYSSWKPFYFQNVHNVNAVIHLQKAGVCISHAFSVVTNSAVVVWKISNEER